MQEAREVAESSRRDLGRNLRSASDGGWLAMTSEEALFGGLPEASWG